MLRQALLAASRNERAETVVRASPAARALASRYVAGESPGDAVRVAAEVAAYGLRIAVGRVGGEAPGRVGGETPGRVGGETPGRVGGEATERVGGEASESACLALVEGLAAAGIAKGADVTVRLSALGLRGSERAARDRAARICAAADEAGATVTLAAEEYPLTEPALSVLGELRERHPSAGVVVPARLRQAEEYCRTLAGPGSRVVLCKGGDGAPEVLAFTSRTDVDRSFARCLRVLMAGRGRPAIATADRRLLDVAAALAALNEREPGGFEYRLPYGVRPGERRRLTGQGATVRIFVPYGVDWYPYVVRRVAEDPAGALLSALGR
ncbi:proline dehydrogenase [Microtetraspora sp. NBRC 13810]|uniref:proline dehydrogenase family protein n=1 Tax=Microtetraspora sp. NBRC 13810 TaxID=3030990 RepID=UPI002557C04D|nr:proline dehydrogenase family protein [Microtetraspora sp. NBRC 13810]GLW08897.1 proline dehydrogenase [Microtetraspora sp. NBRC 13810]